MSKTDIHSCSYYCTRPACVLAQRDEMRDRLAQALGQNKQILRAIEQMKQQAEPVQPEQELARAFNDGLLEGTLREREIWLQQRERLAEPVATQQQQAEPVRRESAPGEQPNALRIADELSGMDIRELTEELADDAAAELRWLHGELYYKQQAEPVAEPPQRRLLTDEERQAMWQASDFRGNGGQRDWFIAGIRAAEVAHGITEKQAEPVVDRAVTSRPKERDYASFVGYARALELYCDGLEQAARQAQSALLEMTRPQRTASESDRYKRVKTAIAALDVALAQQAEPVVDPQCPLCGGSRLAAFAKQAEPVVAGLELVGYIIGGTDGEANARGFIACNISEGGEFHVPVYRKAATKQQAEPVAWMYMGIKNDGTTHGPHLIWSPPYMDAMSAEKGAPAIPLYAAPQQDEPVTIFKHSTEKKP